MIVVNGYILIDPSKRDEVVAALRACVTATRAEPGNIDYRFSPDLDDEARFNLAEIWESEDAMTAHMGTAHLAALLEALGPLMGGAPEITRYDVSGSSKLF